MPCADSRTSSVDFLGLETDVKSMLRGISGLFIVMFLAGAPDLGASISKSSTQTLESQHAVSLAYSTVSADQEDGASSAQSACHHPCSGGQCQTHCHAGHCLFLISSTPLRALSLSLSGKLSLTADSLSSIYLPSDTRPPLA